MIILTRVNLIPYEVYIILPEHDNFFFMASNGRILIASRSCYDSHHAVSISYNPIHAHLVNDCLGIGLKMQEKKT